MSKILGYVAYEGPSEIDGKPIVVIINKLDGSKNGKTGAIVQSFIIRSDVDPVIALMSGDDESVCGQCEHRPIKARITKKTTLLRSSRKKCSGSLWRIQTWPLR
jgi:hypothetical protein